MTSIKYSLIPWEQAGSNYWRGLLFSSLKKSDNLVYNIGFRGNSIDKPTSFIIDDSYANIRRYYNSDDAQSSFVRMIIDTYISIYGERFYILDAKNSDNIINDAKNNLDNVILKVDNFKCFT